jgi:ABC-type multidrug transport system permease subunit
MSGLNPLEKLDIVLQYLEKNHSKKRHTLISLAQDLHGTGVDFGELTSILNKLRKDGYIEFRGEDYGSADEIYMINFEGRVFNAQGGYVLQRKLSLKQLKSQDRTLAIQGQIVVLTLVLAIGTLISGIYYGIEIWKFYSGRP